MLKTRTWIILLSAVLLLAAASALALHFLPHSGSVVQILQDGQVIEEIDLSRVTRSYEFTVTCPEGENTVSVQPGRICVSHADCPDGICVSQGWLSDQPAPIVCLPHRLMIRLKPDAETDLDAVAQ